MRNELTEGRSTTPHHGLDRFLNIKFGADKLDVHTGAPPKFSVKGFLPTMLELESMRAAIDFASCDCSGLCKKAWIKMF